jgi:SAM-dependent methyltransferase
MLYLREGIDKDKRQYDATYYKDSHRVTMSGYMDYEKQSLPLRMNFRILLSCIRRYLSLDESRSVLDVGCAYGFFLDEARKAGFHVHGLDLSESAIKWMEKNLCIKGTVGPSTDAPEGPFDLITAIEVIEHIHDPHSFLVDLHTRLKTGGILLIHTGANDTLTTKLLGRQWWYLNPPDHRSIFSRPALRKLVLQSGFEILEHRITPYYWVGLNNMCLKIARVLDSRWLAQLASKMPVLVLPVFHFSTQLLIAQKP